MDNYIFCSGLLNTSENDVIELYINSNESQKYNIGSLRQIHAVCYCCKVKKQAKIIFRDSCMCGKGFKK